MCIRGTVGPWEGMVGFGKLGSALNVLLISDHSSEIGQFSPCFSDHS